MPVFLLSMDVLLAPMVLLAGSAAAELPAGTGAGPRAGARATVSARIIRGESIAFVSPDQESWSLRSDPDAPVFILPKARDHKTPSDEKDKPQVLIEFY